MDTPIFYKKNNIKNTKLGKKWSFFGVWLNLVYRKEISYEKCIR